MAGRGVPLPAHEHGEAPLQPGQQLARREQREAPRGQLQRQRDAVQPPADLRERLGVFPTFRPEARPHRGGALHQELTRRKPQKIRGREAVVVRDRLRVRGGQGRHPPHDLARECQPVPARRQHIQLRTGRQQCPRELRHRRHHVLAIVQHQQRRRGAQARDHGPQARLGIRRTFGLLAEPQRRGHGRGHQGRVRQWCQLHEGNFLREGGEELGRHLQDEPRLADAALAGQRDEPGTAERLEHFLDCLLPADQRRHGTRQGSGSQERGVGVLGAESWVLGAGCWVEGSAEC